MALSESLPGRVMVTHQPHQLDKAGSIPARAIF